MFWWNCQHEGKGLPGCPLCDSSLPKDVISYLRQARTEIGRLSPLPTPPKAVILPNPGDQILILGDPTGDFWGREATVRENLGHGIFSLSLKPHIEPDLRELDLDVTMHLNGYRIITKE